MDEKEKRYYDEFVPALLRYNRRYPHNRGPFLKEMRRELEPLWKEAYNKRPLPDYYIVYQKKFTEGIIGKSRSNDELKVREEDLEEVYHLVLNIAHISRKEADGFKEGLLEYLAGNKEVYRELRKKL